MGLLALPSRTRRAAAASLEAGVEATIATLYRRTPADMAGKPSAFADVGARGGFFGQEGSAPASPRDETMLSQTDHEAFVAAFRRTGLHGANAQYLNDAANAAFAAEAPNFGRIERPALFVHAARETVCETLRTSFAAPMSEDCANLAEATIDAGHSLILETPSALNEAISAWTFELSIL